MTGKENIEITELEKNISFNGAFICCASFEERSVVIPSYIGTGKFSTVFIFANIDCHSQIIKNAKKIKEISDRNSEIIETSLQNPLLTMAAIRKTINSIIEHEINSITIDISTFTHEMLLMLIMVINETKNRFTKITCVYLGAKDYSINEELENKWLSKGCKNIRNVIGFPGKLLPGRPICLIALVGYEHERAVMMIDEMDPEFLILGKGIPSDVTNKSHEVPMLYFQQLVDNIVSCRGEIKHFDFSCRNIQTTFDKLNEQIDETRECNHIIVPLNNKISTLAAAFVALKNKTIQICYAEPETYNFLGYSLPDDKITLIDNILELL